MTPDQWPTLLARISAAVLAHGENIPIADEARDAVWLGRSPACLEDIAAAEARLGRALPPSLRSFYLVSNGWGPFGCFIWDLLPVEEIDWVEVREPWLHEEALRVEATPGPWSNDPGDARLEAYRNEQGTQVKRSLVITSEGDNSNWLLDPEMVSSSGEWRAGRWSTWNPAMEWIAESFEALVVDEFASFLSLCKLEAGG